MVSRPLVPSKTTMPTIKARKQANGSTRYTAVVRLRRGTTVLHQESRTFTDRTAALSWAKHREGALEDPSRSASILVRPFVSGGRSAPAL
jgi:hypothetical protein